MKLCTKLRQFRGDAQFATWLHRLVVNTCRDFQDRSRVRQTDPLPLIEEATGRGIGSVQGADARRPAP